MKSHNGWVVVGVVVALVCALAGGFSAVPTVSADEPTVDADSPDAVKQTLEQQQGKRVKVKVVSGQDLDGKVVKVGSQVVVLSELSGMELFDATVRLDQVAAVIVRRGK